VSQEESRKKLGDREAILLVNASTTWIRGGFVLQHEVIFVSRVCFPLSLFLSFRISLCNFVCLHS
jgi:hypothetical protein